MPFKRGAPKGNQNRLKHGRYSAAAIAQCRFICETLRSAKRALKEAETALQFDRMRRARDTAAEEKQ